MSGIFISYRRSTSKHFARSIFDALRQRGHDVFLDVNSIDAGAFDSIIRNQIAARPHFLLILSTGALERCANEKDWLRLEIEEAFRLNRNIVPIYDEGFDLGQEIGYLPEPIRTELPLKNAPPFVHYYFDAFIQTLSDRFFKDAVDNVPVTPTPHAEQAEVQQRIEQAAQPDDGWTPRIKVTDTPQPVSPQTQAELTDFTRRAEQAKQDMEKQPAQPTLWGVENILPPPFEWVYIPPGTFEKDGRSHSVDVFNIAKYPITNAQFEIFVKAEDGYRNPDWWDFDTDARAWRKNNYASLPREFPQDNHPRVHINYLEALAFCYWLTNRFNAPSPDLPPMKITLPTIHQWHRAAYGDNDFSFPWGNEFDSLRSNVKESNIGRTTPVTQYPTGASLYGVMDMIGNVSEWCLGDIMDKAHIRGGSWANHASYDTLFYEPRVSRKSTIGFRIVMTNTST